MAYPSRARIALRVAVQQWLRPALRRDLVSALADYRDVLDEVACFTGYTHTPLPMATVRERAEVLGEALPQFRELGLRAGINHLCTLGHHREDEAHALDMPWQRIMDLNGYAEPYNYCPNDPGLRAYTTDCYRLWTQAGPDFIWIDDDVRLQGHGGAYHNCFCDRCLAQYVESTGQAWTRETLREAFNGGTRTERLAQRRRWQAHLRRVMRDFLAHIRAAVDTVNPVLPLGQMTGELQYTGSDYAGWAEVLAGERRVPVMWRPGGGVYSDDVPRDLLSKAHSIGRQIAPLPDEVVDVQSELENFPYQHLKKSNTILTAEVAAYMGAGCTGTALNVIGTWADPVTEHLPYFDAMRACRPFLDRLAATCGRSACAGLWEAVHQDAYSTLHPDGEWLTSNGWHSPSANLELAQIGLPQAYGREHAAVTLMAGNNVLAFSDAELREMLSGGVLLDGAALLRLHELGLGELTGFRVAGTREDDTVEVATPVALNGPYSGRQRDCRQSFKWWAEPAYLLEPALDARVTLAGVDYADQLVGVLGGVYQNALGGRVAVSGFFPWNSLMTLAKSAQMTMLCRWLSRDTLPAYVESYHKVALWARRDAQGHPALVLLNASLDPAQHVRVALRDAGMPLTLTRMDGSTAEVASDGAHGPYAFYTLPELGAWQAGLLAVG